MTDDLLQAGLADDEPCIAPGCELWMSQHSPEQSGACAIASVEKQIADLDRQYDEERAALIDDGAYWGQGEFDGSDYDPLNEMEFERSMELATLRADLEELRNGGNQAQHPAAELEAER
jgi:hypothetical protein